MLVIRSLRSLVTSASRNESAAVTMLASTWIAMVGNRRAVRTNSFRVQAVLASMRLLIAKAVNTR